jgi:plastocyanin
MFRIAAGSLLLLSVAAAGACSKGSDSSEGKVVSKSSTPPPAPASKSAAPEPSADKPPEGPTGTIRGHIVLDGTAPEMPKLRRGSDPVCARDEMHAETILTGDGGGLANVVVRITSDTVPSWVPSTPIHVDQTKCMYRPRVQAGVVGQTVEIANSDETTHNVHARHLPFGRRQGIETLLNRAQPSGVSMSFPLGDEDVTKLKCDYHGWMQGFIVSSKNPYFGVSAPSGDFEIDDVPVGTHQIETWHEYYGIKKAELTVKEGEVATLELHYDAVKDDPMHPQAAEEASP